MKVLIVCSWRHWAEHTEYMAPFIYEQRNAVRTLDALIDFETCFVYNGGAKAYVRALRALLKHVRTYKPDIIHAHYGLCGVVAILANWLSGGKCKVITTYHGSDINSPKVRKISNFALRHSAWNIFVSRPLMNIAMGTKSQESRVKTLNYSVVPCGTDTTLFKPIDKQEARKHFGWSEDGICILFSKSFTDDSVKNYPLAQQAVDMIPNAKLIELYGYSREEVALLMNASDLGLMTSFTEGSPQFVKEALACGCPIVSTDVGDVGDVIEGVENCYLTTYEPTDIVEKIQKVLAARKRAIGGVDKIKKDYASEVIAQKILDIYNKVAQ